MDLIYWNETSSRASTLILTSQGGTMLFLFFRTIILSVLEVFVYVQGQTGHSRLHPFSPIV